MKLSPKMAMQLAIQEAEKGIGYVEPNPPVGCVILDQNYQLLSSGYHAKYGGDHAEIHALKKISNKKQLKNSHIFITLEPCHHQGKTPPCSHTLAQYPIQSITYGVTDPIVKGQGLKYLRHKGIKIISCNYLKAELETLVELFKFSYINKKPFVSLKVASSLDGVIAVPNNQTRWITDEKTRKLARLLRAKHTAVLIGVNTLLQDDPLLNIRLKSFKNKKNKVIILDPLGQSFSFLPQSRLLKTHAPDNIFVVCSDIKKVKLFLNKHPIRLLEGVCLTKKNVCLSSSKFAKVKTKSNVQNQKENSNYFNLSLLLKKLYKEENIQSIVVEGGAFCFSQFLNQRQAQKLYLYMAHSVIGPGLRWSEFLATKKSSNKIIMHNAKWYKINSDFLLEAYFKMPIK